MNLSSFSWIHYDFFYLFGEFSMDSIFFSRIYYGFTIHFLNSLWIHYLFRLFTMNSIGVSRIYYEYIANISISWIHYWFTFFFCEFTIYFTNMSLMCFPYSLISVSCFFVLWVFIFVLQEREERKVLQKKKGVMDFSGPVDLPAELYIVGIVNLSSSRYRNTRYWQVFQSSDFEL